MSYFLLKIRNKKLGWLKSNENDGTHKLILITEKVEVFNFFEYFKKPNFRKMRLGIEEPACFPKLFDDCFEYFGIPRLSQLYVFQFLIEFVKSQFGLAKLYSLRFPTHFQRHPMLAEYFLSTFENQSH